MKKHLKNFLDLFFVIFTIPYNLLIIIFNLNKILKSDVIINFNAGGFGHQFVLIDLSRYVFKKKKILFINFLQKNRHNKHLCSFFDILHFNIFSSFTFSFFFKPFSIGETEGSNVKINSFLIKFLISFFKKNFFSTITFYKFFILKYKNSKNIKRVSNDRHIDIYFNFLKRKKLKIDLSTQIQKKTSKFSGKLFELKKKKKICVLYIRLKFGPFSSAVRSASANFNNYIKIIDYLLKRNYFIIITGDFKNLNIRKKHSKNVFTYKNFTFNKDLFEPYVSLMSDLYISNGLGGGTFYGNYSNKAIGLNFFPMHNWYNYSNILYKNVLKSEKVVDINKIKMKKIYENIFYKDDLASEKVINMNKIKMKKIDSRNFYVRRNSVPKILNFLRNNI
jgi:hypothetical protein